MTRPSFKRIVQTLVAITVVSLIGWVGWINRPRPNVHESSLPASIFKTDTDSSEVTKDQEKQNHEPRSATRPFNVQIVYSPGYLIDLGGLENSHPFDIKKYQKIHDALIHDGLFQPDQVWNPPQLTPEELQLVHTPAYLESLQDRFKLARYLEAGALALAPVSMERAVLQPFRRASGGTLLAGRLALKSGIAVNIGGGYHHAKPDVGEGFCIYADVPIAIRKLQAEKKIRRAVVIDVDAHQGNGTIVCLDNDDSTYTFSMHQDTIYPIPKETGDRDVELSAGTGDEKYLSILQKNLPELLDEAKADICFIVGGCDTLNGDPLAGLRMTEQGIVNRDQMIVQACVDRKLPVVLTLSGGYSPDAWISQYRSIANLIKQHGFATELLPKE